MVLGKGNCYMGVYHNSVTPARAAPPELVEGVCDILRCAEMARGIAVDHGETRIAQLVTAVIARAARVRAYIDEAAALGWPGGEV